MMIRHMIVTANEGRQRMKKEKKRVEMICLKIKMKRNVEGGRRREITKMIRV